MMPINPDPSRQSTRVLDQRLQPRTLAHFVSLAALAGCSVISIQGCVGTEADNPLTDLDKSQGSPSGINTERIAIVASGDDVVIIGEPGAAAVADARVSVENLANGATGSASADAEGAFEITVTGSEGDAYRVEIEIDGKTDAVTIDGSARGDRSTAASDSPSDDTDVGVPGDPAESASREFHDAGAPAADQDGLEEALAGRTFMLEESSGFEQVEGPRVLLSFLDEPGQFRVDNGCDDGMNGTYRVSEGDFSFFEYGGGTTNCTPELTTQEHFLNEFITNTPDIHFEEPRLTLVGSATWIDGTDATLVFVDLEVAVPDESLVGGRWMIDRFHTRDGRYRMDFDEPGPFIQFEDDGSFAFFTTCRESGGEFLQHDTELELAGINYDEETCITGELPDADPHIAAVLSSNPLEYRIEADRLMIWSGKSGFRATLQRK